MTRFVVTVRNEMDKARVQKAAARVPVGYRVEFKEPKRSDIQNDRMWWLLTAVSNQLLWHGKQYSKEAWKDYFMHCLCGGQWMPGEDGGMVPVGRSTSSLSINQHSDLMTLIEAFCARNGVEIEYEEDCAQRVK